jgi:hypothetical protein
MQPGHQSLIAELELAVSDDSLGSRTSTLRRVTDLFLNEAGRLRSRSRFSTMSCAS